MISVKEILILNNLNTSKKNIISCIYKITNPIGKIYIGSTVNLYNRLSNYCRYVNYNINQQPKLMNSFKKYDIKNHKFEIEYIVQEDIQELHDKEIYYVNLYNSTKLGLNCCEGGRLFFTHSEETTNKIRSYHLGRKRSEESILRQSLSLKGKSSNRKGVKLSEEIKTKISISKKDANYKHSEETKRKISEGNKNKKMSKESIEKLKKSLKEYAKTLPVDYYKDRCKVILQYSLKNVFIRETTRTNLRLEGFNVDAIKRVLNGKAMTSHGFIWKYKN